LLVLIPAMVFPSCSRRTDQTAVPRDHRLKREDSFFGIHFDLHAGERDDRIGATLTEGMIDSFLTAVDPDYIQIDCKGHPGISSYPTRVGFRAAGYVGDPLKLWRKITAEHNTALYMHFSGIYDRKVAGEFPQWAVTHPDGSKSDRILSVYSPYDTTYLIPQLKELAGVYQVEGVWVDGECWAYESDYGPEALTEFRTTTGILDVPVNPSDEGYREFMDFQRKLFKRHVARYLEAVHAEYPGFQLTSNWAFSSMMPEKADLDLDYLSGDLTPGNAVNRAAFEARCMASQRRPWDLMAWSFSWDPGRSTPNHTKSALQLEQELAEVMAMGGGVQVYFKQNRDISIQPWTIPIMAEIAAFCRERQKWCHKAVPVPEIAILYSGYDYEKNLSAVYPAWDESLRPLLGCIDAVLDGQHTAEILMEHHLKNRIGEYALIIIPSWNEIDPTLMPVIHKYVESGGRLLLIGPGPIGLFRETLGIENLTRVERASSYVYNGKSMCNIRADLAAFSPPAGMVVQGYLYHANDLRFQDTLPAIAFKDQGDGRIGLISFDLTAQYASDANYQMRDFLGLAIDTLVPDPVVRVSGSHLVHVALNRLNDDFALNLINTAGKHSDSRTLTFNDIPPLGPLDITLKVPGKPAVVRIEPEGVNLRCQFEGDRIRFRVPGLKLHSIIILEY